jgi:hypothetical protein
MCSARVSSPKQRISPGAGCPPLGYYGPSAVYRSSPTQPCSRLPSPVSAAPCGIGESVHCRPKPLRFLMPLHAGRLAQKRGRREWTNGFLPNHPSLPLLKHAGGKPGRKQSLHFSPSAHAAVSCDPPPSSDIVPGDAGAAPPSPAGGRSEESSASNPSPLPHAGEDGAARAR